MENKEKAKSVWSLLKDLAGEDSKEVVKLSSELAEGKYTLEDGTTFDIDAEGNLVNVTAPNAEEAEAEEAAKEEEVAMAKAKDLELKEAKEALELSTAKVAELETEVTKLSKTKKVIPTPHTKKVEKVELTAHMTQLEIVDATLFNRLNKLN